MASRLGSGPSRIPGIPAGTRPRGGRTAEDVTGGPSGPPSHMAQRPRDREIGPPTHGSTSRLPSRIPHTNPATTRKTLSTTPPTTTTTTTIITTTAAATTTPTKTTAPAPSMQIPTAGTSRRTLTSPSSKMPAGSGIPRSGISMPPGTRSIPSDSRSIPVKPLRNTLRRKQPSVTREPPTKEQPTKERPKREPQGPREPQEPQEPQSPRTSSPSSDPQSTSSTDPGYVLSSDRSDSVSPAEVQVATSMGVEVTTAKPITIYLESPRYPELDRYRDIQPSLLPEPTGLGLPWLTTHDLPPPTPGWHSASRSSDFSASPSTRFSESPGFGFYSRETTPTSTSSLSPCLVAPLRIPPAKTRSGSPARSRPPVAWRRNGSVSMLPDDFQGAHEPQGLPSVRESMTSSSSGSTIRAVSDTPSPTRQRKPPPPPLEPPPRKSSYKSEYSDNMRTTPKTSLVRGKEKDQKETSEKPTKIQSPGKPLGSSTMSSRLRSPSTPTVITTPPTVTTPAAASTPARPSREGATGLRSQALPVPVVHSNLSSASVNSERRGSEPAIGNTVLRSATTVSLPDTYNQTLRPTAGPEAAPCKPVENKLTKPEPAKRHIRTPSPNTNTLQSRFPFFRRKTSTSTETQATEKATKLVRKGPAAGTGHEGYGRFGNRRRSSAGSVAGIKAVSTPVSSSESLASNLTTDPFLLERMNPVIIAGGEVKENRNISFDLPRSESSPSIQSLAMVSPDLSQPVSGDRNTLWPAAPFNTSPEARIAPDSRRPSDASEMDVLDMKPKGMARRSLQRLRQSIGPTGLGISKPERTSITSGSTTSLDSSPMSDAPGPRPSFSGGRSITAPVIVGIKKLTKQPKSPPQRKWNLFSWSHKQQQQQQSVSETAPVQSHSVTASVGSVQPRPVAYYMMDSPDLDNVDPLDTREFSRTSPPINALQISQPEPPAPASDVPPVFVEQWKQDEPESRDPATPFVVVETPLNTAPATPEPTETGFNFDQPLPPVPSLPLPSLPTAVTTNKFMLRSGKPSRLPQVGRIPKVIRQPDEFPVPPSPTKIFSRPFNRHSLQRVVTDLLPIDPESIAKGPSPTYPSTPECNDFYAHAHAPQAESSHQAYESADTSISADLKRAIDMFMFSPLRHDSTATSCTTSTSFSSIDESATVVPAVANASGPLDGLTDDDIWHEYDDLIDEAAMERLARVNSNVMWLQGHNQSRSQGFLPAAGGGPIPISRLLDEALHEEERAATCSSVYSDDMPERLLATFGGEYIPTTMATTTTATTATAPGPATTTELGPGHGHSMSVDSGRDKIFNRGSGNSYLTRMSGRSSRSSDDESPLAQVNLRVGSMSVSKWLTFGHVLFSPVRNSLMASDGPINKTLNRHSVLVLDGLDNDDWAYYAAETYTNACFFNLSPRAPLPLDRRNSTTMPLRPPNHHQVQYLSHLDRFPFAAESFRSVVYRFPVAAPESHYRNVVAEARRVLQPGGYIEMAILDADLNNMGNRCRRAIRRIKERLHTQSPATNLTPAADLLVRQLGSQGFVDIKTCRVGIPVASPIARTGSLGREGSNKGKDKTEKKEKGVRTLAEMMNEEGDAADANITRMVARVGRWWYHQCYEIPVGVDSISKSIWADRGLMEECEGLGTSLKLTVCYARVPDGHGRMASI